MVLLHQRFQQNRAVNLLLRRTWISNFQPYQRNTEQILLSALPAGAAAAAAYQNESASRQTTTNKTVAAVTLPPIPATSPGFKVQALSWRAEQEQRRQQQDRQGPDQQSVCMRFLTAKRVTLIAGTDHCRVRVSETYIRRASCRQSTHFRVSRSCLPQRSRSPSSFPRCLMEAGSDGTGAFVEGEVQDSIPSRSCYLLSKRNRYRHSFRQRVECRVLSIGLSAISLNLLL
jgi:hypothetical protein